MQGCTGSHHPAKHLQACEPGNEDRCIRPPHLALLHSHDAKVALVQETKNEIRKKELGHLAALDGQDAELALVGAPRQVQRHVLRTGGGHLAQRACLQPAAAAAAQSPLMALALEVRLCTCKGGCQLVQHLLKEG